MYAHSSPTPRRAVLAIVAAALAALTVAATTSSAAPRAYAATPSCRTSGLAVWLNTSGNGAAGTIFYKLNFTNLSGHACTLRGYPGVSAINLRGRKLGHPAVRTTAHHVRTVTLANGHSAIATVGIVEAGNFAGCHLVTAAGLRVYPPNQRASRTVPFPFQACSNSGPRFLNVSAVH